MVSISSNTQPVYELLAQDIRALGVTTVFGLMSDDVIGLIVTLDAIGIEFCALRHETNAVLAAEGYAAATGGLSIAIIGRGPALANAMHGLVNAARGGSRVLVISGDVEPDGGPLCPDYKRFDAASALRLTGFDVVRASAAGEARGAFARAVQSASAGAPTALLLPPSVQNALAETTESLAIAATPLAAVAQHDPAIEIAARLLQQSKRPLIVAGKGADKADARESICRLAEKLGALCVTSLKAKDFFRGRPYDLGILGSFSHSTARRLIADADCVVAIGASLNFRTTSSGAALPAVPLIQIDVKRSRIGQWHPADVALAGDARHVVERLAAVLPERPMAEKPFHDQDVLARLQAVDVSEDFIPAGTDRTLDHRVLAMKLDTLLPANRTITYDSGNFLMVAGYLSVPSPRDLKLTTEFQSLGAGFGTAIGFAMANREKCNIFVTGDGGLMMALQELETVTRMDVPLIVIVMNDCAYGAEWHIARVRNLPVSTTLFPDIDFAPLAESLGFQAYTIRTISELIGIAGVLAEASEPIFLDCKVNAAVAAPFLAEYKPPK